MMKIFKSVADERSIYCQFQSNNLCKMLECYKKIVNGDKNQITQKVVD